MLKRCTVFTCLPWLPGAVGVLLGRDGIVTDMKGCRSNDSEPLIIFIDSDWGGGNVGNELVDRLFKNGSSGLLWGNGLTATDKGRGIKGKLFEACRLVVESMSLRFGECLLISASGALKSRGPLLLGNVNETIAFPPAVPPWTFCLFKVVGNCCGGCSLFEFISSQWLKVSHVSEMSVFCNE